LIIQKKKALSVTQMGCFLFYKTKRMSLFHSSLLFKLRARSI